MKDKYLIFSAILFFLSMLLVFFSFLLVHSLDLSKPEISVDLKVGKTAAFNLDNDTFSFGTITSLGGASRTIKIANNYSFPIIAYFTLKGNISRFLVFEKQVEILQNEEKIITISTITPIEEDYGKNFKELKLSSERENVNFLTTGCKGR